MRTSLAPQWIALVVAIGWHGFSAVAPCRAGPLLQFEFNPGSPLLFTDNDSVTYTAGTGVFHAESTDLIYVFGSGDVAFFTSGLMTIDLQVGPNGNFVASGDGLRVTGSLDLDGDGSDDASGTLLEGPITAFGADPAGLPSRTFNGLFTVAGGALTEAITLSAGGTVFGGFPVGGTPGGFLLTVEGEPTTGILGNFAQDFAATGGKTNISVITPEPGGLTAALLGTALLAGWRRLRTRNAGAPEASRVTPEPLRPGPEATR